MILDELCTASGICLGLLEFTSETNGSGSSNSFSVLRADVLDGLVAADAAQSEGNISDDGNCQTAEGSSTVADANVADVVDAETVTSESQSEACNDGTESTTADSEVADLTALDLDLGELVETGVVGCQDGDTVDDPFSVAALLLDQTLASVLSGVCNGDDTNAAQADSPYNVRKALGADVLEFLEEVLGVDVSLDVSTSESHAVAPGADCPDPANPDCPPTDGCPDPATRTARSRPVTSARTRTTRTVPARPCRAAAPAARAVPAVRRPTRRTTTASRSRVPTSARWERSASA